MAGSTNFVQINPTATNQQNDSTYDADTRTTNGIGVNAILPSPWLNKAWFQSSTFIAAIAAVIAAFGPGYTITDTSISALETQLLAFFNSFGKLQATRTSKTGTYLSGVTYTNSSGAAVYEEVTLLASGSCTGSDSYLAYSVNGVNYSGNGVWNQCSGHAQIGFWVPAGETFSVTAIYVDGGTTPTIDSWTEVSFT
jgi:hypothetical protein